MIENVIPRDERLRNFAAGCPSAATGHVTISECGICGWLDWSRTSGTTPGHSVEPMEDGRCKRCHEVAARSPEVFNWVLSVMVKHEQGGA